MTSKQAHILQIIEANPGINTLQVHAALNGAYAWGHHKFTYATVDAMLRGNARRGALVRRGPSANGRGVGLYVVENALLPTE